MLWKEHCEKDFRGAKPDEDGMETWREIYDTKFREREEKMKKLAANISVGCIVYEGMLFQLSYTSMYSMCDTRSRSVIFFIHSSIPLFVSSVNHLCLKSFVCSFVLSFAPSSVYFFNYSTVFRSK